MPIQRVLAATDGGSYGEHAVAVGRALSERADGKFMRLAVETEDGLPSPASGWRGEPATLTGAVTRIGGLPGIEIVRQAETWGADLVLLGRQESSPERPHNLGVTSDTVVRRRSGLSLFVPPEVQTIRRAMIALDGSLRGLGVVGLTVPFLNLTRARTKAICVLPGMQPDATDTWRDLRHERVAVLIDLLHLDAGSCELLLRWGDPVPEILRAIRETGSDLLVLGVRRGGFRGDLGSGYIGRELLKSAPCAVLTVPI